MEEPIFSVSEVDGTFCRAGLYDVSAFSPESPSSFESEYYICFPNGHCWIMRNGFWWAGWARVTRPIEGTRQWWWLQSPLKAPYKLLQCNMTASLLMMVRPGAYAHRAMATATLDWSKRPWEKNKLSSQSSQPLKCFALGFYLWLREILASQEDLKGMHPLRTLYLSWLTRIRFGI